MKRLIVFVLLIILLCGLNLEITQDLDLANLFSGCDVEVYFSSNDVLDDYIYIQNGAGAVVMSDVSELDKLLNLKDVMGITIELTDGVFSDVISILNAKEVEMIGDYIYGVCNGFDRFGYINDKNFQMAIRGNDVLIGFPILLGGY